MACKTIQRVSVSSLKLFGPIKTELWAKEVGEFSIIAHPGGLYCPPTLFEMRVQSKKFSSIFSRDFDGISSIVSMWLACSSEERISNRETTHLVYYTVYYTVYRFGWRCFITRHDAHQTIV